MDSILTRCGVLAALASLLCAQYTTTEISANAINPSGPHTVQCNDYAYFKVNQISPCDDLNIRLTGDIVGEPIIYVSRAPDYYPTQTSLSWSADHTDSYSLNISHWSLDYSPGYFYIGVFNDCTALGNSVPAVFSITASSFQNDADDIIAHPELAQNKPLAANGYLFYKFCVTQCADVNLTLSNANYSYPDMFTSRTEVLPTLHSYSYKLATSRRSYLVNAADPSNRDYNGYVPGAYYVAAYGYCIPNQFLNLTQGEDPKYIGGCDLPAAENLVSVTATVVNEYSPQVCAPTTPSDAATVAYPIIPIGTPINGFVSCQPDGVTPTVYYRVQVPTPCVDINFYMLTLTDANASAAEFAIGKYPNLTPKFTNLEWTSYQNLIQNFTISAYDPSFDGGMNCGPNSDEVCELYVGVIGYCYNRTTTSDGATDRLDYTLLVTTTPADTLYGEHVTGLSVGNGQRSAHQICIPSVNDTYVTLDAVRSFCNCAGANDYDMYMSKIDPTATRLDDVFRLSNSPSVDSIALLTSNPNFMTGTYYLFVEGTCDDTNAHSCFQNSCAHLNASQYGLLVAPFNLTTRHYNCSSATVAGNCPAVCVNPAYLSSASDSSLSGGAIAGITIAVIIVAIALLILAFFVCIPKVTLASPRNSSIYKDTDRMVPIGSI